MAKIVVTGVAGFIGSNLAERLLSRGHSVIGIDNLSYGLLSQVPSGVTFVKEDIRSPRLHEFFSGADVVFHFAAKNCISDCQSAPVETCDINITGTASVFEAARRSGVRKVVYAESSALYEGCTTLPSSEDDVAPLSFYAVSKLAGMRVAEAYRRFHGVTSTALRYFCVYGPRQDYRRTVPPLFSAFIIKLLREQRPIIYGTGEKRRDFIHVDDVNSFHEMCIDDPRTDNQVFNLGSGVSYSVLEIYQRVATLLGSAQRPEFLPDQPGEAFETRADSRKAMALGWRPQVSLDTGLRGAVDFIRGEIAAGAL